MAHNQEPRHEEPLNQLYRQRLRPQYPSQQYHAQNHQNSVNNQSTEFSQWPQYELSQQSSDERSTSQDAIRQYAGRGQFIRGAHNSSRGYDRGGANDGQSGRNEGRSQNVYHGQNRTRNYSGEIRRLPAQQRPMDPERRAYVDPRARVPPRPADDSLNRGQVLKHPMPTEPGFDDDPVENPSSDYDKGTRYNDSQEYRLFPQPYQDDQGATVDPEKRFMVETEQQDYGKAYRKEISQGNSDYAQDYVYSDSAEPNLVSTHSQTQSRVDQKPQFHKPYPPKTMARQKSLEIKSWDSPFPTFPSNKGKAMTPSQNGLIGSVAGMSLNDDPRRDRRLQTANSKSSQASSWGGERRPQTDTTPDRSGTNLPRMSDSNHSHEQQTNPSEYWPSARKQPQQNEFGTMVMHLSESQVDYGRRSEDAPFGATFSSSTSEPQRSKTMPNNISEAVNKADSHRAYAGGQSWPETGPNGSYNLPESVEHFPQRLGDTSRPRETSQSAPHLDQAGLAYGAGTQSAKNLLHHPPHSAQNSLGDFYDSYYNTSQQDQQQSTANSNKSRPLSLDEDMPNFNAIPHNYGMSIDDHLPPQPKNPPVSQSPHPFQRGTSSSSRPNGHIAGQISRSKSQPNLNDQHFHTLQNNNGFVFDLPTDAPPVPPIALSKDNFGPRDLQYQGPTAQFREQEFRLRNGQGSMTPFNGPNEGVRWDQTGQQSFQLNGQPEQYRSPAPQNEYAGDSRRIYPGTGSSAIHVGGPASPAGNSVPNPDALPPHPAPIRPGLMQRPLTPQTNRPPPIRQYHSGPSPLQEPNRSQQLGASTALNDRVVSTSVTVDELETLRLDVRMNPADQQAQLTLAKKLVEASASLVDERADQKTRNKVREKYILDAHRLVKKLVSNRSTEATFYLADCYSRGLLGLEVDTKEAFSLYQTAAKAGHAQSAYRVAVCCEMGQEEGGGTKRDPQKAMQWYKRAATLGDTPAMYKIGIIKLKGLLGQPKDPIEALTWLKRAADRADEENPHALHELALLYEGAGTNQPVTQDEAYSRQLFTQAASLGYKFSQFRLGCAYEYGLMGCPVDPRESIAWYSKAAVQEEHQSELALSGWYLTGSEGVLQQSDTEAYLWARKAAQAGLAKAEYAMGYFTEVGIGAPANIDDAKRWYWRSASQNFPKARDRLEDLRKGGAKMQKSRVSRSAIRKQSEGECVLM